MNHVYVWLIAATMTMLMPMAGATFPPPQQTTEETVDLAHRVFCNRTETGNGSDMPHVCDAMYGDPGMGNIRPCRRDDAPDAACASVRERANASVMLADAAIVLWLRATCRNSYEGEGMDTPYVCEPMYGNPGTGTIRPCREGPSFWSVEALHPTPVCTGLAEYARS